VLALIRVDQGTANVADSVQDLLARIVDSLQKERLKVTSVAVADLYRPQPLWASHVDGPTPPSLSGVLRAAAAASAGMASASCATEALQNSGSTLRTWVVNGVRPFLPMPGALLVVLIDSGARPSPLANCTSASYWTSDPVQWVWLGAPTSLGRTHFAFLATPENGDLTGMRARCIGVSGFPMTALDVIAPSSNPYFDPLSTQMNGLAPGLVNRVDLCDALGSGAGAFWADVAARWVPVLAASR
jgi:hypothetical protein